MKYKTAAILAGGKSSRFGKNKALIPFGKMSLIEHILNSLKPVFDEILIISDDCEKYSHTGAKVLPDLLKASGPLGGIHAALSAVDEGYVFITACDMPFISEALITRMQAEIGKSSPSAIVTGWEGFIEPFHAYYSTKLIPGIEEALRDSSCGLFSFLKKISPVVINTENDQTFININTPAELEKYCRNT